MPANVVPISARIPSCFRPQTACSHCEKYRVLPRAPIQNEIGVRFACIQKSLVEKDAAIQSFAIDALQELLGHDHIGIRIRCQHWSNPAHNNFERLHQR